MMLRVQRERMSGGYFPTRARVHRRLRPDPRPAAPARSRRRAVICHPGPMNRGLEIAADAADAARSLVLDQVSAGVAVRMSVLYHLLAGEDAERRRGSQCGAEPAVTKECHEHRDDSLVKGADPPSGRRGPAGRATASIVEVGPVVRSPRRRGHRRRRPGRCCPAWSTCTPTCASRAARTPRPSPPARPRPPSAASPRSSPWPTPPRSPTPPRRPSGSLDLGPRAGLVDVQPVGAVTKGLAGEELAELGLMARSRAAGAGLLRRRPLRRTTRG